MPAKEHDFRRQEHPHAKLAGIVLLGHVIKLMGGRARFSQGESPVTRRRKPRW